MRKTWFEYSDKITSKSLYEKLSKEDKDLLQRFKDYIMISASQIRADEHIREVLRFKTITGKDFNKVDLEDLRYFLKELKQSNFGELTKNKIKGFIHRFLKWNFKDWSERFNEFEDIKYNSDAQNKKEINSKTIFTEKDIDKLLNAEPTLFWKTFLITQYEAGLRTKEVRELTWDRVDFEDDDFTTLNIPSKKNQNGTIKINPVYVRVAGNFLKELKEQHRKHNVKTPYVFPAPANPNKPISKAVNLWFNKLCKRALGRPANNYLLRHSRGTQLQEKVRNGKLSKDNAVQFMRHSPKMFDKVYSHMDNKEIKKLMKEQIYNTEDLTAEKKTQLEQEVEKLKEQMQTILLNQYKKRGWSGVAEILTEEVK